MKLKRASVLIFLLTLGLSAPAFCAEKKTDGKIPEDLKKILTELKPQPVPQKEKEGVDPEWEALKNEAASASISTLQTASEVLTAIEQDPSQVKDVRYLKWTDKEEEKTEIITVVQGNSQILRFDRPLARVAVSSTDICDITTLGAQEVLLYCSKAGRINLLAWDQSYRIGMYSIQSTVDTNKLKELLKHIDPLAKLDIVPYGNSISIYGYASTNEKVRKIEETARYFSDRAVLYVRVQNPKQILLEVRFAEIDRRASSQYGLDWEAISRFVNLRGFTGEANSGAVDGTNTFTPNRAAMLTEPLDDPDPDFANNFLSYTTTDFKIQAFLNYLSQRNILKLIARPNLLALDGQYANFVVGGESPYITATTTSSNVEFKEFGTKLGFTPQILDDGKIRLQMNVEVSELDFSSTVSLQGTVVPTLVKTTHQTVAELKDDQTLVVGGLINQRINKVEKRVPFLGRIPVIEKAFSRQEFERKDIELLIVVTPHVVNPFNNVTPKIEIYKPEAVADATSISVPAYPDLQGDMINRLLVQDERYHDFDGFTMRRAKEIESEFSKLKEKDGVINEVMQKTTGLKIQEKAKPFPPQKTSSSS